MAPKRKLGLVSDEPPAAKRLRSRIIPVISTPTKFDSPTSRRDQLRTSARKGRGNASESHPSSAVNELEDISNVVQEVPEACRTPRPRTRALKAPEPIAELEKDSTSPNAESSGSQLEKSPVRRQSRRGTQTVAVVLSTSKASSRTIKRAKSNRTPEPPRAASTSPSSPSSCGPFPAPDIAKDTNFVDTHLLNPTSILPIHLHSCFHVQQRLIMKMLQHTYEPDDSDSANTIASRQLRDLLDGTVGRAEGNSCLLLGPRGSGKTRMVEKCLSDLADKPVILRLSGWVETTDRHALREIAIQLLQQTGTSLLSDIDFDPVEHPLGKNNEEDNPFLDTPNADIEQDHHSTLSLPPSSHLHSLIPALLSLNRPVIVILDAFDLFALHPRQSLLYCLLDTVQNCRASSENRGIAVIGVTSRLDTIQLLEKRVKSRFSGRAIRTAPPNNLDNYLTFIRKILRIPPPGDDLENLEEWNDKWTSSVDQFLEKNEVLDVFREMYSISRDTKVLSRVLTNCVLRLELKQPYLSPSILSLATESQRSRPPDLHLTGLAYPSICLLISSTHLETGGQDTFTFEMLFSIFRDQVRASTSAPVQVNGGSIGMVRCTREVLMSSFEDLVSAKIFIHATGTSAMIAKEFVRHRCVLERIVVKKLVDESGQVNLKKWLNKAQ